MNDEDIHKARAIIESYLGPADLEQMWRLLRDDTPNSLTGEQKQAIRNLFQAFGYVPEDAPPR